MAEATEDDVMTLVYTSGTTGPPKGAMLAVSNVEFCIKVLVEGGGFASPPPSPADVMLSYLPLCHVAERVFTTWFNAGAGIQVHFAESIETVQANLREVQPTILFGVPRIWEKVLAGGADPDRLGDLAQAHRSAGSGCGWPTASPTTLVAHRRPAHLGTAGALRDRLGVLLPGAAGADRHAQGPPRGIGCRARSRPRCCGSSWASGCRCTRSTG